MRLRIARLGARWAAVIGVGAALILSSTEAVWGQPPSLAVGPPEVIRPGEPREANRPREADFRPDNIRAVHDPVFLPPLFKTVPTGCDSAIRVGLSGWTAPPGRGNRGVDRETSGWLALGVSVAWNVSAEPVTAADSRALRC